jgi:hypothetical protein
VAISAMTRAVARAATTGEADLVKSSGPGRRLSDVGERELTVVLMRRPTLSLSLQSSIDFDVSVSTSLLSSGCLSPLRASSSSASSFFFSSGSSSEIASALALAAASSSRRSRASSASFDNRSCSSLQLLCLTF